MKMLIVSKEQVLVAILYLIRYYSVMGKGNESMMSCEEVKPSLATD